ncbi:unnamed protein product [Owenia fusiformis]|uniref:Uncharacterized protein n=1 Tax=Owenia fusiformis TaxID=6347 RepID=A0A8J1U7K5_OWEFU|nr:unnamed protein product [Owenia fusiformis]
MEHHNNFLVYILVLFKYIHCSDYQPPPKPDEIPHPKDLFEAYYKCLERKNAWYLNMKDKSEAKLIQEGHTLKLDCNICISPAHDINSYTWEWKVKRGEDIVEKPVILKEKTRFLTDEKTLVIKGVQIEDAGDYFCLRNNEYEAVYRLDVVLKERRVQVVESGDQGRQPKNSQRLDEHNLWLFTSWSSWTRCNHCDKLGQRRRIGICTVKKINSSLEVLPIDAPVLAEYPEGVPCRSTLIPMYLSNLPVVLARRSETMMGYCKIPCPTIPPPRNITDDTGAVIETVNEAEGFYSLRDHKDGKPTFPPLVKRQSMYLERGKRVYLECPHEKSTEELVHWQNGTLTLNPRIIRKISRGRVRIDTQNRLHIRRLQPWDEKAYSCWISGKHIATIKIIVTEVPVRNLKDYIAMAGFAVFILVFCCICVSICKGRNKKTAQ